MKADVLANPAPGLTADELAAQVARLDTLIAQAQAFEADAAEPCNP